MRRRWLILAGAVLATGWLVSHTGDLVFDSSNEAWMIEGDESLELMTRFKEIFGNDDFVLVYYDAGDFFTADPIRRMAGLVEDLEEDVPHLLDATWLGNAEWIEGRGDRIEIEPLLDPLPESADALARARRLALSEPSFVDALVSAEGDIAAVLLEMDVYPDDAVDPRKDVTPAVRGVLARPEHESLRAVAVGGPIVDHDIDVLSIGEAKRLGLFCLLIQVGILAWLGRGLRGVLAPAVVVLVAVMWTFGLIGLLGFKLNLTVVMVPVLIICVGIGDSMHVIAEFNQQRSRGEQRRKAMNNALSLVGWPCILTSVTTAAGFLAFLSADIRPFRELGIYAALGVWIALALTLVLVPILYSWGSDAPSAQRPRNDVFERMLSAIGRLVVRRPRIIVAIFLVLTAVCLAAYSRVVVSTDTVRFFRKDVQIRQDLEWVDAHMGGSMSLEVMLDTGEPDGILDADFLHRFDEFERRVAAHPLTAKTISILDVMRKMRRAFNENREEYYDIPETREEASQFLLLYDLSGGDERGKLVSFQNDVVRLTARTRSLSTVDVTRFAADVQRWADEIFGADTDVELTGMLAWARAMTDLVARGQSRSLAAAIVAITFMMLLVLRSLRLALISMIPNVFPVLMSLGLMGLSGVPMDIMSMCMSALIIGVAVDDTIHFFVRFRSEFSRTGVYAEALEATLTSVGRPITFTTMTLTLGFGVMSVSQVATIGTFGWLSGYAFLWALLADFFFAPALLVWLEPLGPERAPRKDA